MDSFPNEIEYLRMKSLQDDEHIALLKLCLDLVTMERDELFKGQQIKEKSNGTTELPMWLGAISDTTL